MEKAISRRAPNADAAVVAAFVSQQTKDADALDNRARHVHVIEALAHRPALQEEATTRALCRLAREAADTGDVAKGKIYLEALNTLEACRRFGGALSLFERVCSPADDVSKELRRLYCKGAFGELRLKRFVFERVGEDPQMAAALDRHEREVLAKVLPPPPPPPRPPSPPHPGLQQLATFLEAYGLDRYAARFREEEILSLRDLTYLDAGDLVDVGLSVAEADTLAAATREIC